MIRVALAVLVMVLMALMTACGGGGGDGPVAPPAPVLSTVTVAITPTTIQLGQSASAVAELRTAAGAVLTGRAVSWSSSAPAVASVDASGVIASVSVGTATITATSEGKSGSASITVTPIPVASVTFTGATRVKVGDTYPYTFTARLADGTVVNRPVTWGIAEAGRAVVNATGMLMPLQAGTFTLQVLIDGGLWTTSLTAYDWESVASGGTSFITLDADSPLTNRLGVSERPQLVVACGTGSFFLWVRTPHIVTQSGIVAYGFDGGPPISATWQELSPDYRTLWQPGTNATKKEFSALVSSSRQFIFAFGEFQGTAKATTFRVTGMAPLVAPLYTLCPSNAIVAGVPGASGEHVAPMTEHARVMATYEAARGVARSGRVSDDATARAVSNPRDADGSALLQAWPLWTVNSVETRQAKRVR